MAGLCMLQANNESVKKMAQELLINPNLEIKDTYKDENIQLTQVALKGNKFKSFEQDGIVIFVDGYVYNIEETNNFFASKADNFTQQLFYAYQNNILPKLLNKTDGYFCAVIYDKKRQKILLISDRLGTRFTYYYFKNNVFAFCGSIKGLLAINNIEKNIDKKSVESFVDNAPNFYLLGDNTFFEDIKLINPATILEYDITNNKLSRKYYWTFGEIKKSNISYEDAIDVLHELVEKAVLKRIKNIDLNDCYLPLSGGLDSRLIFAILNNHNKIPSTIYTKGLKDCTDVIYAKKLCKKYGYAHNLITPTNIDNYIENGMANSWNIDGMIPFVEYGTFPILYDKTFSISGYIGDLIFGKTCKDNPDYFDKKMDSSIAESFYGNHKELSNYESEYFDIEKIEPSLLMNRVRRYTTQMINHSSNYCEIIMPYIDNDIIDFIYSIPDEYRENNYLYADMLLKYYGKYFKTLPWNRDNLPIRGKIYRNNELNINYVIDKINNSKILNKKWKNSILKRINFNNFRYKKTFHIYNTELSKSKNIDNIKQNYLNKNSLLIDYISPDVFTECELALKNLNTWKIAVFLTIEFYLRNLKSRNYI